MALTPNATGDTRAVQQGETLRTSQAERIMGQVGEGGEVANRTNFALRAVAHGDGYAGSTHDPGWLNALPPDIAQQVLAARDQTNQQIAETFSKMIQEHAYFDKQAQLLRDRNKAVVQTQERNAGYRKADVAGTTAPGGRLYLPAPQRDGRQSRRVG